MTGVQTRTGDGAFDMRHLLSARSRSRMRLPLLRRRQSTLIESLNEVASSISGARDLADVPAIIVDAAKRFTGTEKVVLRLFEDRDHGIADDGTGVFVRGSRDEYLESWWQEWLPEIMRRVLDQGDVLVETDTSEGAWVLAVPVRVKDRSLGVLCAINSVKHRLREEQVAFLTILGAFAAASLENARLAEESRFSLLASERERISREMHDGIAQSLFSISLGLEVCKKQVVRDPVGVSRRLDELQAMLEGSMGELRRYIYDLRPARLQELGLLGAIEYWMREIASGHDIEVSVQTRGDVRPLSGEAEACLYRVAREATTNAVKHSGAANVSVRIDYGSDDVTLLVEDDGNGFDVSEATSASESGATVGLRSLHERVRGAGGGLAIDSSPGEGCRLCARVPC